MSFNFLIILTGLNRFLLFKPANRVNVVECKVELGLVVVRFWKLVFLLLSLFRLLIDVNFFLISLDLFLVFEVIILFFDIKNFLVNFFKN